MASFEEKDRNGLSPGGGKVADDPGTANHFKKTEFWWLYCHEWEAVLVRIVFVSARVSL